MYLTVSTKYITPISVGMDRLTHDDGSLRPTETKNEIMNILQYFEDRSSTSETQIEFTEVIQHTFGESGDPLMEPMGSPFDDWMETIVGASDRINDLGSRLNELSAEVAEEDETYNQVYQDTAEFIFSTLEDAE